MATPQAAGIHGRKVTIMTLLGWLFLILSWGVIVALCVFCYLQLAKPGEERLHSPLDIEADIEEAEDQGKKIHPAQGNMSKE